MPFALKDRHILRKQYSDIERSTAYEYGRQRRSGVANRPEAVQGINHSESVSHDNKFRGISCKH